VDLSPSEGDTGGRPHPGRPLTGEGSKEIPRRRGEDNRFRLVKGMNEGTRSRKRQRGPGCRVKKTNRIEKETSFENGGFSSG
jgi:hypothetical protein